MVVSWWIVAFLPSDIQPIVYLFHGMEAHTQTISPPWEEYGTYWYLRLLELLRYNFHSTRNPRLPSGHGHCGKKNLFHFYT